MKIFLALLQQVYGQMTIIDKVCTVSFPSIGHFVIFIGNMKEWDIKPTDLAKLMAHLEHYSSPFFF
jgi:hypothetical protein